MEEIALIKTADEAAQFVEDIRGCLFEVINGVQQEEPIGDPTQVD